MSESASSTTQNANSEWGCDPVLAAYSQWLSNERNLLHSELGFDPKFVPWNTEAQNFHLGFDQDGNSGPPSPASSRAKIVLRAVGAIPESPLATAEDYAAMEFEPWEEMSDGWHPPTASEWFGLVNSHRFFVGIAWSMLHMTKADLTEKARATDNKTGTAMMHGFIDAQTFFSNMLKILNAAEVRYLSAGSAVELEDPPRPSKAISKKKTQPRTRAKVAA